MAIAARKPSRTPPPLQRFRISGGQFGNHCKVMPVYALLRAVIPDFRPRLANRCSHKVKTEVIPAAQGLKHYPAAGECRMGRLGRGDSSNPAGRLGRGNPQHQAQKKSPDSSLNRDSQSAAATYSPTWCSSTIGASELNFSVRDGKRWILTAITAAI